MRVVYILLYNIMCMLQHMKMIDKQSCYRAVEEDLCYGVLWYIEKSVLAAHTHTLSITSQ